LDGNTYRTENIAPYALAGDNNGYYKTLNLSPGNYVLEAIPWSGASASGTQGVSGSVSITVIADGCGNNNNNNSGSKLDGSENSKMDAEIMIYPNPNQGVFEVKVNLEESSELEIRLYDLSGKVIFENSKSGYSGVYNEKIYLRAHAVGMYFLSVNIDGNLTTEKIIYTTR